MQLLPIKLALYTLRQNKSRSALTIVGIVIGIALVIIVLAAGNGVKSLILDQISSFGDNWIEIEIKIPSAAQTSQENISALSQGVTITTLTIEDAEAVMELDNVVNYYAAIVTQSVVTFGDEKKQPMIYGISPSYAEIDQGQVEQGHFFTQADNDAAAQVVVLGYQVKQTFFGESDPVGKRVKVGTKNFEVVGVMEQRGSTGFFSFDEFIFIPIKTVQKKLMGIDYVQAIIAQVEDNSKAEATAEEMRWIIRDRHDITDPDKDDFAVVTMAEALDMISVVIFGMTVLLVVLGGISLVVGGVGIMNVMYVSVAERTFEIGLRKSVGAREKDILWQFLAEAVIITLIGGIFGIIFGALVAYGVALGAQASGLAWEFSLSLWSIILAVGFSMAVGLVFGLYPAKKAAELDPIRALTKE